MLVPSYLEFTIGRLASEQAKFREKIAKNFGGPLTTPIFESIEEQARKNMALFEQALAMFSPFGKAHQTQVEKTTEPPAGDPPAQPSSPPSSSDLDEMKRQLDQLQKRIETLLAKESK
jgi:polyhydroxyalkanoate synthesis regulator protein